MGHFAQTRLGWHIVVIRSYILDHRHSSAYASWCWGIHCLDISIIDFLLLFRTDYVFYLLFTIE